MQARTYPSRCKHDCSTRRAIALSALGDFDAARSAYRACLAAAARGGDLRIAANTARIWARWLTAKGNSALPLPTTHGPRACPLAPAAWPPARLRWPIRATCCCCLVTSAGAAHTRTGRCACPEQRRQGPRGTCPPVPGRACSVSRRSRWRGSARSSKRVARRPGPDRTDAADLVACDLFLARGEIEQAAKLVERLLTRIAWDDPDRWRVHLVNGKTALETGTNLQHARQQLDLCLALGAQSGTASVPGNAMPCWHAVMFDSIGPMRPPFTPASC